MKKIIPFIAILFVGCGGENETEESTENTDTDSTEVLSDSTEIDSVDWANNIDNHNGGFDVGFGAPTSDMGFVINTPGS